MYKKLERLNQISNQYDAFLIDAWGVLHDGASVFSHAYECLKSLKKQSKSVVIISNAARRSSEFDLELAASGIYSSMFDFSLSSGELFWQNAKSGKYAALGKSCYYLGPERSKGILYDLELDLVNSLEAADFIMNTGAEGNLPDVSSFLSLLKEAANKQLPMICANPDLAAIRKGVRGISAGAIAKQYQQMGGEVEYIGKPHTQIYKHCLSKLADVPKSRILMIGDGLQTDILGANKIGIDSVFIRDGIYAEQIKLAKSHLNSEKAVYENLFKSESAKPDFMIDKLVF
jgi:HAD superfamily hydrolase (TIGR01459 family)